MEFNNGEEMINIMKNVSFIIITVIFSSLLMSLNARTQKYTSFDENYRDPFILMDDEQFYIWDKTLRKVVIYSMKSLKRIAEFGKKGEGPGEFISINCASLDNDYIYISSFPKLCIFSKNGIFKKEIKGNADAGSFKPFGKYLLGISHPYSNPNGNEGKMIFGLFDSGLKKEKDIYTAEYHFFAWAGDKKENILWIRDCIKAVPFKSKLIIGTTYKGFYFIVFDQAGNMLYEIKKEYEKRKVTESDKKRRIDDFKKHFGDQRWNEHNLMYNIVFPEYYPAFSNFIVDRSRIYVFLIPEGEEEEILILNLEGQVLGKNTIPSMNINTLDRERFTVWNGKLYYLEDNLEEERWELHELNIDSK